MMLDVWEVTSETLSRQNSLDCIVFDFYKNKWFFLMLILFKRKERKGFSQRTLGRCAFMGTRMKRVRQGGALMVADFI